MFECSSCTYPQSQTFNSPLAVLGLWPQLSFLCFLHILAGELRFFLKNKRSFLLFGNQSVFLRALAYDVRYIAGMELLPIHSQTSPQGNTHPLIWVQSKIIIHATLFLEAPLSISLFPLKLIPADREALGIHHPSAMCVLSSVR